MGQTSYALRNTFPSLFSYLLIHKDIRIIFLFKIINSMHTSFLSSMTLAMVNHGLWT